MSTQSQSHSCDLFVLQATPAGIAAAVSAARRGLRVILAERSAHLGGLPANGLGATDIGQRGSTGGFFTEFRQRIIRHYTNNFGPDSPQLRQCDGGHKFEPHVAEAVFEQFLQEQSDHITVLRNTQFDAEARHVAWEAGRIASVLLLDRASGQSLTIYAATFIDATYEGDLAAAAGLPFRLGREGAAEHNEPVAGVLYRPWIDPRGTEFHGHADHRIQAYNYRLCLTKDPANRVPVPCPPDYDRSEYTSLLDDLHLQRWTGIIKNEQELQGIGRLTNLVYLPNHKTDANNQHLAFISTDLPEENQDWPTASWQWRDQFAARLRNYTLGLLWFAQNDPEVPAEFRKACSEWGLAADEYKDNDHFPRQVYVREARRILGDYLFTAHDSLPADHVDSRPPVHHDSVTASHYPLDSHACQKREPGKPHLEGFFNYRNRPYSVPFRVIHNRQCPNLLFPVAVSGTHVGFSTLRMEPCWMALGQAAGTAAALAITPNHDAPPTPFQDLPVAQLQHSLLAGGAVLLHFHDASPDDPAYRGLQLAALHDTAFATEWFARLEDPAESNLLHECAARFALPAPQLNKVRSRRDLCLLIQQMALPHT